MLRLHYHRGEEEIRRSLHDGVDSAEEIIVSGIEIMVPQMCAEPCSSGIGRSPGWLFARCGEVPYIGHHVEYPSAGAFAIEAFCGFPARWYESVNERFQRLHEFLKPCLLHRPIVHLEIDVGMIVAVPRSLDFVCPQALEVRRQ